MDTGRALSPRDVAALKAREGNKHSCTAEVHFTDEELEILEQSGRSLFTRMPFDGPGFECYGYGDDGNHHYGRSSTISAILHICQQWADQYPDAPRIGVGDISLPNGGDTPSHQTHEVGIDVDFSLVTNNGVEEPSNWKHANYSRELTQAFLDLIFKNSVLPPRVILFNDPHIPGVEASWGHDDHIHVRFRLGENIPPRYSPDDRMGALRMINPYMKGDNVAGLQEGLIKAGISIEADSIFGQDTEKAVKEFQEKHELVADGIAGSNTLAKLDEIAKNA